MCMTSRALVFHVAGDGDVPAHDPQGDGQDKAEDVEAEGGGQRHDHRRGGDVAHDAAKEAGRRPVVHGRGLAGAEAAVL